MRRNDVTDVSSQKQNSVKKPFASTRPNIDAANASSRPAIRPTSGREEPPWWLRKYGTQ